MKNKYLIIKQNTKLFNFLNKDQNIMQVSSFIFDSLFSKVLSRLMKHGKKNQVFSIFFECLMLIKNITRISPIYILRTAIHNVKPLIQIKMVTRGRKIWHEPSFCSVRMQLKRALSFIISNGINLKQSNSQLTLSQRLTISILNCFFKQGESYLALLKAHYVLRNRRYKFLRFIHLNKTIYIRRTKKMKGYYHQNRNSLFRKLQYSKWV